MPRKQRPDSLAQRLDTWLWSGQLARMPPWRARLVWLLRLVYALFRDLTQGYLSLHAMSLVYTTLLSLVPLLAVSFSVLKGFGVHNQLEPLLLRALQPLGDKATEVARNVVGFVDNMQVGVLGSLGLVILLFTVVTLIQKIEEVLNYTWRAESARSFSQRFSRYFSVLLIGPVLFFSAVGLSASVRSTVFVSAVLSVEPFGSLIELVSRAVPLALLALTFAFIYVFVPNTRVRVRSALIGGLAAALLWQAASWIFAHSMASSTQYTAVYSGLAIPILFMIWVYIAWLILLAGASVAFYHQHPEYLGSRFGEARLSNRLRERLALLAAGHIARSYARGEAPWDADGLACALGAPKGSTRRILEALEREGYLIRSADTPPGFLPARSPEGIPVTALLGAVRCFEERSGVCQGESPDPAIGRVEREIDSAVDRALDGMTLRDLAHALGEPNALAWDGPADTPPAEEVEVPTGGQSGGASRTRTETPSGLYRDRPADSAELNPVRDEPV